MSEYEGEESEEKAQVRREEEGKRQGRTELSISDCPSLPDQLKYLASRHQH